jgi:hypothetical protein
MRRTLVLLGISALVLGTSALPSDAITYGEPDGDLHPEVGALVVEWEGELLIDCSGTLIAPTVFWTAAHCVIWAPENTPFYVTFDTEIDVEDVEASTLLSGTVFAHPDAWMGGMSEAFDIAVVVLDEPVTSIDPAVLPGEGYLSEMSKQELREAEFTPVGYGATRITQQGGFQSIVDIDGVRRYANQSFLSLQKAWLLLSMNPATGNGGTCYGDSGGPHFLGGTESHLIVSITVTGDSPCKATDKTYRLDTTSARDFLDQYVELL